jgi:ferredoxin
MAKRKIIEIDREKCNGCGLCTKACAEGALVLDEHKKAVLVKEIFCDGMGACLDVCPVGALKIVEKDSNDYDPKAAFDHVLKTQGVEAAKKVHPVTKSNLPGENTKQTGDMPVTKENAAGLDQFCNGVHGAPGISAQGHAPQFVGCPGSMAREFKPHAPPKEAAAGSVQSELGQWPIQLHLISPMAPHFKECDLLIAADCTAFALGSFHQDMLRGKKLVIACSKLDETEGYIEKIAELLKNNTVYSLTVAIMEVPCCSGLFRMVQEAVELSGTHLPVKKVVIGLDGAFRS